MRKEEGSVGAVLSRRSLVRTLTEPLAKGKGINPVALAGWAVGDDPGTGCVGHSLYRSQRVVVGGDVVVLGQQKSMVLASTSCV